MGTGIRVRWLQFRVSREEKTGGQRQLRTLEPNSHRFRGARLVDRTSQLTTLPDRGKNNDAGPRKRFPEKGETPFNLQDEIELQDLQLGHRGLCSYRRCK